ncbi:Hsp20/alpha crystallin family protein [Endozoicomonas sp. SCSIO W0465]|uniref:Hsp20/alpha crystallin family protein n=1 Tax=Endozoicomonas TaxID=305899 RepID=UPI0020764D91|nr:Hsp20/alpha crystallin family protein [Endozoicomonas sp. SCSIO W0465]USE35850.1 Hsp20/alpha crystallin family protein [Endozoicomonas sp. SCSIO W0465]
MSLTLWDPFVEMENLLDKYGRSSRKSLPNASEQSMEVGDWMPSADIVENPESFNVKLEIPGVDRDDVKVTVENNVLSIKGEKKYQYEDKKHHRIECSYGSFVRSFTLPNSVDGEKVEAVYNNGTLELVLPKQEKAKPRLLEIKVQ